MKRLEILHDIWITFLLWGDSENIALGCPEGKTRRGQAGLMATCGGLFTSRYIWSRYYVYRLRFSLRESKFFH